MVKNPFKRSKSRPSNGTLATPSEVGSASVVTTSSAPLVPIPTTTNGVVPYQSPLSPARSPQLVPSPLMSPQLPDQVQQQAQMQNGIVRPRPVYATSSSAQSQVSAAAMTTSSFTTPPASTASMATSPLSMVASSTAFRSTPTAAMAMGPSGLDRPAESENKLSVGIDFGTTFSGVAYGSNRLMGGEVRTILSWPGSYETYRKIPTCILYGHRNPNEPVQVLTWGLEAKTASVSEGMYKLEWFKLFLDPNVLRDGYSRSAARLPALPPGKTPFDVIVDFLSCLWVYAKRKIIEEIGAVSDLDAADVVLTVPAAWDAAGCDIMRNAAIKAGMVQSARGGDKNWRERLRIITEPEAASVQASTLAQQFNLRPSNAFILCDAGGGTVDCASYRLIGDLRQLEIAEQASRTGANCGSLFLDLRFEELIKQIFRDHPVHTEPRSLESFRYAFAETDKLNYQGEEDDHVLFRFTCFNIEDGWDPDIGLEFGELAIPGHVLRREVFDPVVDQVVELIEAQYAKTPDQVIHGLVMVGGFAASQYLFSRIQTVFGSRISSIVRPADCDVATLKGAARYGLGLSEGRAPVSSVTSPRSYIMRVKLPAEDIDKMQRPAFITTNQAGVEVCENRLSYLVAKGAVLRKGQRLKHRFCKYSKGPNDSVFTATLYVSDVDRIFRWTDEGETHELCRWSVDLSPLPNFCYSSQNSVSGGFYTEFDIGLELDSAEVRAALLTDEGEEVGRATFEFIGS